MLRKRPKSLDAPIVTQAIRLEMWAYKRADQWKRKYRYTLVHEFRLHITAAKNEIITAFELHARLRNENTINSYLGMLRHMSAFKLRRRMCSMIENSPLTAVFDYAEDYTKITIRHRYSTQVFYMAAYRATKQRYRLAA